MEKKNGKGKKYSILDGKLEYEGEYKNDNKEGYGIYYFTNGDKYEGEFKNDNMEGYGTNYFTNGDRYEGEFKNDISEGYGIIYFSNGDRYEGTFKDGIFDGFGIFYSSLGFQYKGYFQNVFSTRILVSIYKILLFLNYLYSKIMKNKMILFLIIILIFGILIN